MNLSFSVVPDAAWQPKVDAPSSHSISSGEFAKQGLGSGPGAVSSRPEAVFVVSDIGPDSGVELYHLARRLAQAHPLAPLVRALDVNLEVRPAPPSSVAAASTEATEAPDNTKEDESDGSASDASEIFMEPHEGVLEQTPRKALKLAESILRECGECGQTYRFLHGKRRVSFDELREWSKRMSLTLEGLKVHLYGFQQMGLIYKIREKPALWEETPMVQEGFRLYRPPAIPLAEDDHIRLTEPSTGKSKPKVECSDRERDSIRMAQEIGSALPSRTSPGVDRSSEPIILQQFGLAAAVA